MSLQIEKKIRTEKICQKCGKQIKGKTRECPYCGGDIISKVIVEKKGSKSKKVIKAILD